MTEELLDLVDYNDKVIGMDTRKNIYKNKLSNFRTINAFIIRDNGDVWIPTRSNNKELWPNSYDTSIGGHVKAGESYQKALLREASEETSLDLNKVAYYLLAKLIPPIHHVSSFMHLYVVRYNQKIIYNREEFCNSKWMNPIHLLDEIQKGIQAKPDLVILIKYLLCSLQLNKR
jgi:isopentenyl-diphosphate delta-isomerase